MLLLLLLRVVDMGWLRLVVVVVWERRAAEWMICEPSAGERSLTGIPPAAACSKFDAAGLDAAALGSGGDGAVGDGSAGGAGEARKAGGRKAGGRKVDPGGAVTGAGGAGGGDEVQERAVGLTAEQLRQYGGGSTDLVDVEGATVTSWKYITASPLLLKGADARQALKDWVDLLADNHPVARWALGLVLGGWVQWVAVGGWQWVQVAMGMRVQAVGAGWWGMHACLSHQRRLRHCGRHTLQALAPLLPACLKAKLPAPPNLRASPTCASPSPCFLPTAGARRVLRSFRRRWMRFGLMTGKSRRRGCRTWPSAPARPSRWVDGWAVETGRWEGQRVAAAAELDGNRRSDCRLLSVQTLTGTPRSPPPLPPPSQAWRGCSGSAPDRRGYTCGLWQLFHTLAARLPDTPNSGAVWLAAVKGFVGSYFQCSECAKHFMKHATGEEARAVATKRDACLWMWKAHNIVSEGWAGLGWAGLV